MPSRPRLRIVTDEPCDRLGLQLPRYTSRPDGCGPPRIPNRRVLCGLGEIQHVAERASAGLHGMCRLRTRSERRHDVHEGFLQPGRHINALLPAIRVRYELLEVSVMGCLAPYLRSFDRVLRSGNKSPRTREIYLDRAARLDGWLERLPDSYAGAVTDLPGAGVGDVLPAPEEPRQVTAGHIAAYVEAVIARTSAATGSSHYRALQQFFKFLAWEEVIDRDPFARLDPVHVEEKPVPVIRRTAQLKLLAACKGKDLASLRDTAIIMVFIDIGLRLGEVVGLDYAEDDQASDVDFEYDILEVLGKGGRRRSAPFGSTTGLALERYLPERNQARRDARLPVDGPLWISLQTKGRLTGNGIAGLLDRRSAEAGIGHINPHRFRHTFAHEWRLRDGGETDLMRLMGWNSRQMLTRYGVSAADERARAAHRKNSPCDRLLAAPDRHSRGRSAEPD